MSASHFVWYELMTADVRAAAAFYSEVVGWKVDPTDPRYTLLKIGDAQVAGMLDMPAELHAMGMPATWSGYVAVADVDATAARVLQLGGKVLRPAGDIPDVGRFAVVADPQGSAFLLFKPDRAEPPPRPAPDAPGTVGWHELRAPDGPAVFDFYATLFGWTKGEGLDMGPMGVYQLFEIDGVPSGAIMTREPDSTTSGWRFYVRVDAMAAAAQRVTRLGGQVTMGPQQVAGGNWVLNGRDPQGAVFALMSMAK